MTHPFKKKEKKEKRCDFCTKHIVLKIETALIFNHLTSKVANDSHSELVDKCSVCQINYFNTANSLCICSVLF